MHRWRTVPSSSAMMPSVGCVVTHGPRSCRSRVPAASCMDLIPRDQQWHRWLKHYWEQRRGESRFPSTPKKVKSCELLCSWILCSFAQYTENVTHLLPTLCKEHIYPCLGLSGILFLNSYHDKMILSLLPDYRPYFTVTCRAVVHNRTNRISRISADPDLNMWLLHHVCLFGQYL